MGGGGIFCYQTDGPISGWLISGWLISGGGGGEAYKRDLTVY